MLLVGESPGAREAQTGVPFVGPAGGKLNHFLYRLGRTRDDQRVANCIQCRPPEDKLEGAWYEDEAVAHCRPNLDRVLAEDHKVIVTLGASATKRILGLGSRPDVKNFHGTVTELSPARREQIRQEIIERRKKESAGDPLLEGWETAPIDDAELPARVCDKVWVVPTFHPSHILRGAHNLTGTVLFDLHRAFRISEEGWVEDKPRLIVDPDPERFASWVDLYLAECERDPECTWMAVDIETPDKQGKLDEGELKASDRSMEILRVNFSFSPDEGVTVPFVGAYIHHIGRILASAGAKCLWNKAYDLRRLRQRFAQLGGALLDFMDAWHALHSDTPKGLGFVAPHYSSWGPWKHLSATNPGLYGAGDGVQTIRCAHGIAQDLHSQGMWNVFWRHMHELDRDATSLSCEVGLKIDRKQLEGYTDAEGKFIPGMQQKLSQKSEELYQAMQHLVPAELRPLHPRGGWKTDPGVEVVFPAAGEPHSSSRPVFTREERQAVKVCQTCGAKQVAAKHRCKDPETGKPSKTLQAQVQNQVTAVPRWYVREDFNPLSPPQVMAYIKHCGHKPGREKGKETTNRETIERLADAKPKNRRDEEARELYHQLLDYRDVKKVLGTYVEGILRRLDDSPDDRVHPVVNNNPSTLRTAYNSPNLQNVVADRRGGESLSAGFRKAITAEPGCKLIELDWSGVEAVNTGWCAGDPEYIKLAWLGVHDFLTSHAVHRPADLSWPIDDLLAYFKEIKAKEKVVRDQCKRMVHGCVPGDHEVLTHNGWVRFDELQDGTPVAQWDAGEISFVVPSRVVRIQTATPLIEVEGRGIRVRMTPEHRVPVASCSAGVIKDVFAGDLTAHGVIPVSGQVVDGYVEWNPLLALSVAVQADATLNGRHAIFHLTQQRKLDRLDQLLKAANLPSRWRPCGCHPGGSRVSFCLPAWAEEHGGRYGLLEQQSKRFALYALLQLTAQAREAFLEELLHWDGSGREKRSGIQQVYLTTDPTNAAAVQTVAHLTGRQALIRECSRESSWGKKPLYKVSFNRRRFAHLTSATIRRLLPRALMVYCVTVPSGWFLVRHQNTISVTGNSNYLESSEGIYRRFRKLFHDLKEAQGLQSLYFTLAPKIREWQHTTQELAHRQEFLGGPGAHPFGYRHEFYNVYDFRLITEAESVRARRLGLPCTQMNGRWYRIQSGEDAKRCIAFFPQSIAAGMIRETALRLFSPGAGPYWLGADGPFGKTPLRAIIHDSFLLEVPDARVDVVIEKVAEEMTRPFPELHIPAAWGLGEGGLRFGVEVKVGTDWATMEKVPVPQPWLAILKGRPANGTAAIVDLADQVAVDEVEDDEEEDPAAVYAAAYAAG